MPARPDSSGRRRVFPFEFKADLHRALASDEVSTRTQAIKRAARAIGFDLVGIADAVPLDAESEHYRRWIERGHHADLEYMRRNAEKRRDVETILPGTASVIVVGCNYFTPHRHAPNEDAGKISRYAWGDDYHDIIPPRLNALGELISANRPGSSYRAYTDTGPLLEKQWARRAGIGWQGKHSNIINREIGSWFFLGLLLSTEHFSADRPIADYCGTCSACVEACPTGAIEPAYNVDARRCISYWTIETKADREIPEDIAAQLDGWLFGCDVCQDVCPWNRFESPSDETRFQPRGGASSLPLEEVAAMEQSRFSQRFRGSPLKRAKLAGLQRNAAALNEWRELRDYAPQTRDEGGKKD